MRRAAHAAKSAGKKSIHKQKLNYLLIAWMTSPLLVLFLANSLDVLRAMYKSMRGAYWKQQVNREAQGVLGLLIACAAKLQPDALHRVDPWIACFQGC